MFTQFFGNFLLSEGIINSDQLLEILKIQNDVKVKMGTLAMYEGLMIASEVEKIHIMQTHIDKRFGELAIEEGYLTHDQVEELCKIQKPDYITFGQALVDKEILSQQELEDAMIAYQTKYGLDDKDYSSLQKDQMEALIKDVSGFEDFTQKSACINYMTLLFNNLIRFIGKDFTPLNAMLIDEYATTNCTYQNIGGDMTFFTGIDLSDDIAIEFASRYMGKEMKEYDEFVTASVEDFLNLHNGLYSVNMSNELGVELDLYPLEHDTDSILSFGCNIYYLPIIFPFGTINMLIGPKPVNL